MAHVQIHAKTSSIVDGTYVGDQEFSLKVDGVDISESVLGADFMIEWPEDLSRQAPVVCMRLSADVLDLDMPRSLLDAIVTKAGL